MSDFVCSTITYLVLLFRVKNSLPNDSIKERDIANKEATWEDQNSISWEGSKMEVIQSLEEVQRNKTTLVSL